ncbi:MAG: gluconokinase [Bacteroidota bacterium]
MEKQILVIVMGVSGTGKSSVGRNLAERKGWAFIEADDLHSKAAKAQMASGQPLDESIRAPWIDRICKALVALRREEYSVVLACSALKRPHRDQFRSTAFPSCLFLFLNADKEIIAERMTARANHFMPASLLDSQFEALDWPTDEVDVVEISVEKSLHEVIEEVEYEVGRVVG